MEKRPAHRPPKPRVLKEELENRSYGIEETARVLGLNHNTIRRAINAGELYAKKYGREWQIRPEAIKDYIERSER